MVDVNDFGGFEVRIEDETEPHATYTVRLYSDAIGDPLLKISSPAAQTLQLAHGETGHFYLSEVQTDTFHFVRVTQSQTGDDHNHSADDAWTAPIWLVGDPEH